MDFNTMDYPALCALYAEGPRLLKQALEKIPASVYDFRPPLDGAWTISEHIRHVADSEANFYLRAKLCVAEPGATIMVLDEEAWAEKVYPPGEALEPYLALFSQLRQVLIPFLNAVTPEAAQEAWVNHPVRGRMTLKNLLMIYVRHVYFHLEYLERNHQAFLKAGT